jgi:hypothetical protein
VALRLASFDAIWCVPGSPYRNMAAALLMIGTARREGIPFLGTCGGFQHALIEYARDVAGIEDAEHAESSPSARHLVIEPLSCSLVGAEGAILPLPEPGWKRSTAPVSIASGTAVRPADGYRHLTESRACGRCAGRRRRAASGRDAGQAVLAGDAVPARAVLATRTAASADRGIRRGSRAAVHFLT